MSSLAITSGWYFYPLGPALTHSLRLVPCNLRLTTSVYVCMSCYTRATSQQTSLGAHDLSWSALVVVVQVMRVPHVLGPSRW